MKVICRTTAWEPGGYYFEPPAPVTYSGEVVCGYYDPERGETMFIIRDGKTFRRVPMQDCEPVDDA